MRLVFCLLAFGIAVTAGPAAAEIYSWTDERGQVFDGPLAFSTYCDIDDLVGCLALGNAREALDVGIEDRCDPARRLQRALTGDDGLRDALRHVLAQATDNRFAQALFFQARGDPGS